MASNVYDAIIIGGGHNGLTSGAYFARHGARTVVLEGRHKTGGAADTSAPFADHPEINVTTYSYVMSLMPPTIIRELQLKRFGYDVTPFGPYFQAFPDGRAITVYADDAQKSYDSIAQFSKRDADTLEEWEAWMKGVADVLGPLLIQPPPKVGSMAARRPALEREGRVADAQARRARRGRRDPAVHDERHRPAGRLVRVRRGEGHAHGERRDRHVGRPGRARHRLRDAAPLDRRRRRRPPRLLGLPAGRDGRRVRRDPRERRALRRRDPHGRAGREDRGPRRPRGRRGARGRAGAPRAGRRHDRPPEDRVPRPDRPRGAAERLRDATSSGGRRARAS